MKKKEEKLKLDGIRKRTEKIEEEQKNIENIDKALTEEAVQVAGQEVSAAFGGNKELQIHHILHFLKENTPQWHMDLETYQSPKNIGKYYHKTQIRESAKKCLG